MPPRAPDIFPRSCSTALLQFFCRGFATLLPCCSLTLINLVKFCSLSLTHSLGYTRLIDPTPIRVSYHGKRCVQVTVANAATVPVKRAPDLGRFKEVTVEGERIFINQLPGSERRAGDVCLLSIGRPPPSSERQPDRRHGRHTSHWLCTLNLCECLGRRRQHCFEETAYI